MLRRLFSFQGRASRKEYWSVALAIIAVSLILTLVDTAVGLYDDENEIGLFSGIFSILSFLPSIAVSVKRFHDHSMSGWWIVWFSLLTLLPFLFFLLPGGPSFDVDGSSAFQSITAIAIFSVAGIVQLIQFVILGFLPGHKGKNRFGSNPFEKDSIASEFD